jgi:hypothetical protein
MSPGLSRNPPQRQPMGAGPLALLEGLQLHPLAGMVGIVDQGAPVGRGVAVDSFSCAHCRRRRLPDEPGAVGAGRVTPPPVLAVAHSMHPCLWFRSSPRNAR